MFGIAGRLAAAGCEEIAFGDTTGMANPRQVRGFFERAREQLGGVELTAHFHNTRGQGLANVLAALEVGHRLASRARSRSSAAARCRRARPATSPARTWSRCCTRWGSRPASTSSACSRCARRAQEVLGRPLSGPPAHRGPGRLAEVWRHLRSLPQATSDRFERHPHVIGCVADLTVREPDRGKPGREVRLVAHMISRLLRWSAVVAQAVGLDHES